MYDIKNIPTPYQGPNQLVKPEWIDHNGHMNVAFYLMAFDESISDLFNYLDLTRDYRKQNQIATYCGDFHIRYIRELFEGAPLRIINQVVGCDEKRIHLCQSMYHGVDGYLAAQSEIMYLHISLQTKRVSPMGADLFNRVEAMRDAHACLQKPESQGRVIGSRR
jgi:acyl-CoA thioester hydrolase